MGIKGKCGRRAGAEELETNKAFGQFMAPRADGGLVLTPRPRGALCSAPCERTLE